MSIFPHSILKSPGIRRARGLGLLRQSPDLPPPTSVSPGITEDETAVVHGCSARNHHCPRRSAAKGKRSSAGTGLWPAPGAGLKISRLGRQGKTLLLKVWAHAKYAIDLLRKRLRALPAFCTSEGTLQSRKKALRVPRTHSDHLNANTATSPGRMLPASRTTVLRAINLKLWRGCPKQRNEEFHLLHGSRIAGMSLGWEWSPLLAFYHRS